MERANWRIPGIVTEARELKTSKDKGDRTWAYSIKVASMGATFDLQTKDEAFWNKHKGEGLVGTFTGTFDIGNGRTNLMVTKFEPAKGVS